MAQRPEPSFLLIIQIHHLQALLMLGQLPNPMTGKPNPPDPAGAQHELALLEILREKTEGNLSVDETALLNEAIETIREALLG